MTGAERVRAELEVLGLDASRHVLDFYAPLLDALGVTRSREVLHRRSRGELLVAGVKVATQTPPVRSGRRVVFLTLDDSTGPVDATFFEDAQGPYAGTVFHSWLLVVRGVLRRTGPRGVSLRATGAWELPVLWEAWADGGLDAVQRDHRRRPGGAGAAARRPDASRLPRRAVRRRLRRRPSRSAGAARERRTRPPRPACRPATATRSSGRFPAADRPATSATRAGGMGGGPGHRRVLVHPAGSASRRTPTSDPAGDTRDTRSAVTTARRHPAAEQAPARKLWHASPGSSGR